MANDIDIVVGVKDLATTVLDRLSFKVNSMAENSKLAFAGAAERLNDQLAKASGGPANGDKLAKAIDSAITAATAKIDVAVNKTNSAIDGVNAKIQTAISTVTNFVTRAAAIATTAAAFVKVGSAIASIPPAIAGVALGMNAVDTSAQKAKTSVLGSLAPFAKYVVATGATVTLAKATIQASSATNGLVERAMAVGRGALAAFVLRNALKKTEEGASTLGAKLAKVAGIALAFDVAGRATLRFGLSLVGLGKKSDETTAALTKTANAGTALSAIASKVTAVPFNAIKTGATSAAVATASLSSHIEDLPRGADSVNSLVTSFGNFAAQLGGIPGLLLAIPAGIAGVALAAFNAASKTERQLTQLTNKLGIIQAAKLNVRLADIDARPLYKLASQTELVAKQIQTATNVQSSKLLSLATSSLSKGLDPGKIGEALKASVGLAEVYGTSIEDGMYKARQAMEGNFESFEKLIPSLKTMTKDSDKLAAVSRLAANGFRVMSMESNTFWGTIEKVKNGLGNTLESLGRMRSLSDLVATVLRDVVTPAVIFLDSKLKGFGFDGRKVLEQAKTLGAGVIAAIETISNNWMTVVDRMTTSMDLFWVKLESSTQNFVKNTLPWLGENLGNVFKHAANTVGTDGANNLAEWSAKMLENNGLMPKGLSNRFDKMGAPFQTTPIPAMKQAPKSPLEIQLEKQLKALDVQLGTALTANFDKARDALNKVMNDQAKVFDINLQKNDAAPSAAKKDSNAFEATLQAVNSRVLTMGSTEDPNKQIAASSASAAESLRKILIEQEKIARAAPKRLNVRVMSI